MTENYLIEDKYAQINALLRAMAWNMKKINGKSRFLDPF
jgi:hypothetical protein